MSLPIIPLRRAFFDSTPNTLSVDSFKTISEAVLAFEANDTKSGLKLITELFNVHADAKIKDNRLGVVSTGCEPLLSYVNEFAEYGEKETKLEIINHPYGGGHFYVTGENFEKIEEAVEFFNSLVEKAKVDREKQYLLVKEASKLISKEEFLKLTRYIGMGMNWFEDISQNFDSFWNNINQSKVFWFLRQIEKTQARINEEAKEDMGETGTFRLRGYIGGEYEFSYQTEYWESKRLNREILKDLSKSYTTKLISQQNRRTVRVQNRKASENIGARNFKK